MAEVMTFDTLVSDLSKYPDREDASYLAQVPRLIMLAEQRIAMEVRGLGFLRFVTSSFSSGSPVLIKPDRWRETSDFQYVVNNKRVTLRPRTLGYCRTYWPQGTSATRAPKYYSDYDFTHFFIAPTPDQSYGFELAYHERPLPLSATNESNWTTDFAPGVLLNAALMEAALFRKRWNEAETFKGMYDRAAQVLTTEDKRRESDRNQLEQ